MAGTEKIDDDMSMDEILASIRRIISEDSKNEDRTLPPSHEEYRAIPFPSKEQEAISEPVPPRVESSKPTEQAPPPFISSTGTTLYGFSKEGKGEFFSAPPEFGSMRPPAPAPAPQKPSAENIAPYVASQTTPPAEKPHENKMPPELTQPSLTMGDPNSQLQAFIYDLMQPLLKDWVNAYLPNLIEKAVAAEVSKMFQKLREP